MIHTYVCIIILSFFIAINHTHKKNPQDKILKTKDKERRREANDGEAYALVYGGRGRAFSIKLGATAFSSIVGP